MILVSLMASVALVCGVADDKEEAATLLAKAEEKVAACEARAGDCDLLRLEASVQAVQDAGGRVVKEPFSFPGGRRFHFLDPSGNELAVWSDR